MPLIIFLLIYLIYLPFFLLIFPYNTHIYIYSQTFARSWIFCRHLTLMLDCFRGMGQKKSTEHFGTYRVELVVYLFHRLVDMHNFEIVLRVLSPYEAACVICRMGWLNTWNPCKPEGAWQVDMTRPEERLVAKVIQLNAQ